MHLIEDTDEGFTATPVRVPAERPMRYTLGDGAGSTMEVSGKARLLDYKHAYRGYLISYDPPPIPSRAYDYSFAHVDYDGPGDPRFGRAESVLGCRCEIDLIEDERA